MTVQVIPVAQAPSQSFDIQLGSQNCTINIYQKSTGLFFDLFIDQLPIVQTVLCLNFVSLIREQYLGFIGQLAFVDTVSDSDPVYTGLGTQYLLIYQT